MKSPILIIDPFVREPVNNCFNRMVEIYYPHPCMIWQPVAHSGIPDFKTSHHFIIVLGSASHVFHQEPWHLVLAKYLHQQLKKNIPVLGICFGHQLMANYYGSKIEFAFSDERKILQTRKIQFKEKKFRPLLGGISHRQIVSSLGRNLESLIPQINHDSATNLFANDAIRHKRLPFLGVQPHLEASDSFLKKDCQINKKDVRNLCLKDSQYFLKNWQKLLS
ncbi:MAG: gamma-glutamyl-gamma-aminobutyrate hydrolase family protein [Bacteriovoracaceae bacterium]|nr:gamma-glutamyl-gamma-aminobutyrate hydrolase family protein [Bacteriovoracaceae bacterium]